MNSPINIYFFFFIIFLYYIITHYYDIFKKKLKPEEHFTNLLNNYNVSEYSPLNTNLYSYSSKIEKNRPILYTNYKYSYEYKLGFELAKILKIDFKESKGLNYNLLNLKDSINSLLFSTETDYLKYIDESKVNNYRALCSLYKVYFMMISRVEIKINSWNDLLKKKQKLKRPLRIGIPNKYTGSYNNAQELFDMILIDNKGIKIDNDKNTIQNNHYKFITNLSEKDLFIKLSKKIDDKDAIDLIYLTTSYKNFYLEEYLLKNICYIFGTDGIGDTIIETIYNKYGHIETDSDSNKKNANVLSKTKFINSKITDLTVKKNIYENFDESNFKYEGNINKSFLVSKLSNTYATRILLLCHKDLDKTYIKYLLRNIYASIDNIKFNMMKYLLNDKRNNIVDDLLDYHEMSYVNKKIEYHPGAYEFYKEIHFISNEEDIEDNIYTKIDKKNIFSKLFITNN